MQYPSLIEATLIKRYKRFLADVRLPNGDEITVHCPNTGAMTGCAEPGSRVWLLKSSNPKRKYAYTWEWLQTHAGEMICIHSAQANKLLREALENQRIAELLGYTELQAEVPYGETPSPSSMPSDSAASKASVKRSRIDLLLSNDDQHCYVEVKSVTLLSNPALGQGEFPDAVSDRAARHVNDLLCMRKQGARAVLFFCVMHEGISRMRPAWSIDPRYAELLAGAVEQGLEVLAYGVRFNRANCEMVLESRLPFSIC